jgi:hypothetical protein
MLRRYSLCLSLLLVFCLGVPFVRADVTGTVSGVVHDASGAAIPDAAVVITEVATNINRAMKSSGDGQYTFLSLAPGRYKIVVTATGFRSSMIQNIDVKVNDQLRHCA